MRSTIARPGIHKYWPKLFEEQILKLLHMLFDCPIHQQVVKVELSKKLTPPKSRKQIQDRYICEQLSNRKPHSAHPQLCKPTEIEMPRHQ